MTSSRAGLALLAVVAPLVAFAVLGAAAAGSAPAVDRELVAVSEAFYDHETAWNALEVLLRASIAVGAAIAVAVLGALLWHRRLRSGLFWALAVGGVLGLDPLLKAAVRRPGIGASADQWSFPSGNAMASAAIALAATVLLWRSRWRYVAVGLGAAVVTFEAIGVVILGWHYASDVVGGWCVAVAWVMLLAFIVGPTGESSPKGG